MAAVAVPADSHLAATIVDGTQTRHLRRSVLRPHLSVDHPLPGDDEIGVVNFAVVDADGVPLSTCILLPEACPDHPDDDPVWRLRQMATDLAHQGHGHGQAVLAAVIDFIATRGGGTLWCNARETAIAFYERAGLTGEGASFDELDPPIPHLRMWRYVAPRAHA